MPLELRWNDEAIRGKCVGKVLLEVEGATSTTALRLNSKSELFTERKEGGWEILSKRKGKWDEAEETGRVQAMQAPDRRNGDSVPGAWSPRGFLVLLSGTAAQRKRNTSSLGVKRL